MGSPRQLIAAFRSEREADGAADALREFGFREGDDLARRELAEGRYLIEDEEGPDPIFDVGRDVVVGTLVGAAAGSAWVSIAFWGSVTPLLLITGALGGAFIGFVVGLEVAAGEVTSDRDGAVRSSSSGVRADVIEERASAPGTRRCRSCPRRSVPTGSAEHARSGRASKVR